MIMIDKDQAERNAIMNGKSSLVCLAEQFLMCVCQFHIVQAILRWMASAVKVPQDVKVVIIQHFRLVQRCRNTPSDPWEESLGTFERSVANTCASFGIPPGNTQTILQYFRDNWFCYCTQQTCAPI